MDVKGQQAVKKAASMTESCAVCETLNRSFNLMSGLLIHSLKLRAHKKNRWVNRLLSIRYHSMCTYTAVFVWVYVVKHPCVVDRASGAGRAVTQVWFGVFVHLHCR